MNKTIRDQVVKNESVNNHLIAARISVFTKYRAGDIFRYDQWIFPGFDVELNKGSGNVKSANKQAG